MSKSSLSLADLLKQTSRSFYLTMRVLPAPVRPQIGLAYLLARATDTIADTEIVPVAQRLQALRELRERILGQTKAPLNFTELARLQGKQMLRHCDDAVRDIEFSKDRKSTRLNSSHLRLSRMPSSA